MSLFCSFSDFSLEAFDSMSKAFIWVASFYFSASLAFLSTVSISFLAKLSSSSFFFLADPSSFSTAFLFSSHCMFLFCSLHQKHFVSVWYMVTGREEFFINLNVCHFNLLCWQWTVNMSKCSQAHFLKVWSKNFLGDRKSSLYCSLSMRQNVRRILSVAPNSSYYFDCQAAHSETCTVFPGQNYMKPIYCGDTSWLQRWTFCNE